MDLQGKAVLVTGGGTGIGAAVAGVVASLGGTAVLLGPERTPLETVAADTGGLAVVGDAAEPGDVRAAVALTIERFGGLDGLVACAGAAGHGSLTEIADEQWARTMRLSLDTAVVSSRECLPALAARRGAIVLMSSAAALAAPPHDAAYTTAKAALLGLTRSLATDYGPAVRINALLPGLTRTATADIAMDGLAAHLGTDRDGAYARVSAGFPLRRPADPVEIARVAVFLISEWSSFITGATISADGGGLAAAGVPQ